MTKVKIDTRMNTNVTCQLFHIERPAQSSVENWNLSFMMISRRTNDCRTRDYSHERVNKVYLKKILSQFKRWLALSFSKFKFEGGGGNGRRGNK